MNAGDTSRRFRTALFVVGCSLLCVLLVAIAYDPVALVSDAAAAARLRWQLPRARERWQATAPASYSIRARGAVPLTCFVDAELTVRGGQLAEVVARENPLVPESPLVQISPDLWEVQGCSYRDLTIEAMFSRVATGLSGIGVLGAPIFVEFDPVRGFITEYRFGRASQGGVFGYTLSECCVWFEFTDFEESPP